MMYEDAKELSRHAFIEKYGGHREWIYDKIHGEIIREILKESLARIDKDNERNKLMGRVKDWLIEMEEAAAVLSLSDFLNLYGPNQKEIWDRVNTTDKQYDLGLQ